MGAHGEVDGSSGISGLKNLNIGDEREDNQIYTPFDEYKLQARVFEKQM